jgi:GNAT superfamily N-acetyltransferase
MTVKLREATVDDVPTVARLIRALSVYEKLEYDVVMTEEKLRDNLFGDHRYAEVVLAEDGAEAVGFALFFHNFSTFLGQPGIYLEDLFVDPEKRGHGVGRMLLAHLAQLAVERDCGRLEWSVLNWNRDAIGFYEKLGARPNSEWTVYRLAGKALHELAGQ